MNEVLRYRVRVLLVLFRSVAGELASLVEAFIVIRNPTPSFFILLSETDVDLRTVGSKSCCTGHILM